MATVNKRTKQPQAMVINGVDAGGKMQARIQEGYDKRMSSSPDGLEVPLKDKSVEYVRGSVTTQDWIHFVDLLTGVVGTYVFYERKSGVAPATGYIKHTLNNPVIYNVRMLIYSGANNTTYATITFDYECRPADETKGIADMHEILDSQAAPAYITAARGGLRIESTVFGSGPGITVYHATSFEFSILMNLVKACNDSDVGYTCVDAELENMICSGSISFQDSEIVSAKLKAQQLITASRDTLVITVRQSGGATSKVITIAGVDFVSAGTDSDVMTEFTSHRADFEVTNDTSTQLTLSGANKIITIADAA